MNLHYENALKMRIHNLRAKIKRLEKQGPGAGMAAAAHASRLRELEAEAARNEIVV